jgi:hypothetical protein
MKFPLEDLEWALELYGSFFAVKPHEAIYSREHYAYVSPQIRYRLIRGIRLDAGIHILALPLGETTNKKYVEPMPDKFVTSYPLWKLQLGFEINWTALVYGEERISRTLTVEQEKRLFESLLELRSAKEKGIETTDPNSLDENLKKLVQQRRNVDKDFKDIKKLVGGETEKPKPEVETPPTPTEEPETKEEKNESENKPQPQEPQPPNN